MTSRLNPVFILELQRFRRGRLWLWLGIASIALVGVSIALVSRSWAVTGSKFSNVLQNFLFVFIPMGASAVRAGKPCIGLLGIAWALATNFAIFVLPVFAALSISRDKEEGHLDHVLLTRLSAGQIVRWKTAALCAPLLLVFLPWIVGFVWSMTKIDTFVLPSTRKFIFMQPVTFPLTMLLLPVQNCLLALLSGVVCNSRVSAISVSCVAVICINGLLGIARIHTGVVPSTWTHIALYAGSRLSIILLTYFVLCRAIKRTEWDLAKLPSRA